jgi:hypothetical protein
MGPAEYEIPARDPGETADHYLNRVTEETRIKAMALKEKGRIERRIRSNVERVIIERAVREAMPRAYVRSPPARGYNVPKNLWWALLFAPLYLLGSILFQDYKRDRARSYQEIPVERIERKTTIYRAGGDNDR